MTNFFKMIIFHEKESEMNLYNISVVFAPCLLRSKVPSFEDLEKAGNMVKFILLMI